MCLQVAFGVPRGGGSKSILADSTVAIGGSSKRQGNSSTLELSTGSFGAHRGARLNRGPIHTKVSRVSQGLCSVFAEKMRTTRSSSVAPSTDEDVVSMTQVMDMMRTLQENVAASRSEQEKDARGAGGLASKERRAQQNQRRAAQSPSGAGLIYTPIPTTQLSYAIFPRDHGTALDWFVRIPTGHITTFQQFSKMFVEQYIVNKAPGWQKGRKSGGSCSRQLSSWRVPISSLPESAITRLKMKSPYIDSGDLVIGDHQSKHIAEDEGEADYEGGRRDHR